MTGWFLMRGVHVTSGRTGGKHRAEGLAREERRRRAQSSRRVLDKSQMRDTIRILQKLTDRRTMAQIKGTTYRGHGLEATGTGAAAGIDTLTC